LRRELQYESWTFPRDLTERDVARLLGTGLGMKCDDCSTEDCEVYHPVLSILNPEGELRMINDLLKEPVH
jgi:hypothetical protein